MFLRTHSLLAQDLCTPVRNFFCFCFVFVNLELLTSLRRTIQTKNKDRSRRTGMVNFFISFIHHGFYTTIMLSTHYKVSRMQRTVLHKYCCYVTASFIKCSFNDSSCCFSFSICFQVEQFGFKQDLFQKQIYIQTLLGRKFLALEFTTPLFNEDVHASKLLVYLLRICSILIYLVDSKYHWNTSCLRVADGLTSLRHDSIVGCDNDHSNICYFGTT